MASRDKMGNPRLLATKGYDLVIIEPWSRSTTPPPPGVYWCKGTIGLWEIIHPDGEVHRYEHEN